MTYKGDKFKQMLGKILQKKHSQLIEVNNYFTMLDNTVNVNYDYREGGETKNHSTNVCGFAKG